MSLLTLWKFMYKVVFFMIHCVCQNSSYGVSSIGVENNGLYSEFLDY